ncbi:hypothetical protein E8E12_002281 [Didymella heteroderae]|uniref:TLC domain-containing protein n=1 Tax=Didymella heteroderae TaxID=1769908 RepID=A0A9P4WJZ1_9PLEO|nr:hypothetical protein E8E12_002281 [Didymella heteroderae]
MRFLPHDIEFSGNVSALPKNAHAIQKLIDKLVSSYAHHGFLLMTVTLIVFFIATRSLHDYLFPRIYKEAWKKLSAEKKRTFTNHHVLISAKILMISLALYPYLLIVNGLAGFGDRYIRAWTTTNGDVIVVATAIFIAMYLHELLHLSSLVSWISVMHHLGACLVASIMVTRNVRWEVESSTAAYTVLIMTYGTVFPLNSCMDIMLMTVPGIFDLLAGLWPRPCMVVRTVWPEKHRVNMWLCYTAFGLTVVGTLGETIVALYLYGINFKAWSTAIQCVTPISHGLFAWAQLSSSKIMWILARKAERQLRQQGDQGKDAESPPAGETISSVERA